MNIKFEKEYIHPYTGVMGGSDHSLRRDAFGSIAAKIIKRIQYYIVLASETLRRTR